MDPIQSNAGTRLLQDRQCRFSCLHCDLVHNFGGVAARGLACSAVAVRGAVWAQKGAAWRIRGALVQFERCMGAGRGCVWMRRVRAAGCSAGVLRPKQRPHGTPNCTLPTTYCARLGGYQARDLAAIFPGRLGSRVRYLLKTGGFIHWSSWSSSSTRSSPIQISKTSDPIQPDSIQIQSDLNPI